jgi:hypothetical protein
VPKTEPLAAAAVLVDVVAFELPELPELLELQPATTSPTAASAAALSHPGRLI